MLSKSPSCPPPSLSSPPPPETPSRLPAYLDDDVVERVQGVRKHRIKGQALDGDLGWQAVQKAIQGSGDILHHTQHAAA